MYNTDFDFLKHNSDMLSRNEFVAKYLTYAILIFMLAYTFYMKFSRYHAYTYIYVSICCSNVKFQALSTVIYKSKIKRTIFCFRCFVNIYLCDTYINI